MALGAIPQEDLARPRQHGPVDGLLNDAAEVVRAEYASRVELEDRTFRVVEPVKGDPGITVLRLLGLAQAASPVGAAVRGTDAIAAGVWRDPELYIARWLKGRRWIVGYRVTGSSRLTDYVRAEGRVPTRFETGHWYDSAPDGVSEAFFDAGILLDDPPFPVPPAPGRPETAPAKAETVSDGTRRSPRPSPRRKTGAAAKAARAVAPRAKRPAVRLCQACRMNKAETQFIPGSDRCVDCR